MTDATSPLRDVTTWHRTGAELASAARHQTGERGVLLMLLTAASITALKNTGLGFIVGACSAACSFAFAAMQLLSSAGLFMLLCWPKSCHLCCVLLAG